MRTFCIILTIAGCAIMTIAAVRFVSLIKQSIRGFTFSRVLAAMILFFFVVGFIVGGYDLITRDVEPIYYFVVIVFFLGASFILALIQVQITMTNALKERNVALKTAVEKTAERNRSLQATTDLAVKEIVRQDELMQAVNDIAAILLTSNMDDFDATLHLCMGLLADAARADRAYVWKGETRDGETYSTQIYEWSERAQPQQNTRYLSDKPLKDRPGGFREVLARGESINGPIRLLSSEDRAELSAQDILSILIVPVFVHEQFWGFVGFDDCHRERVFSGDEESMLRAGSLLIGNALVRNEAIDDLVKAREAALAGMRAKTDFLANMSHEIRTPINAITGMATIARSARSMEKVHSCLDKIDASSRQLLSIINDILDMSKIEAHKFDLAEEVFDLAAMVGNVESIISGAITEKHQTLIVELSDSLPEAVIGDDVRLSQVLLNILSNAIKFTPEHGRISLSLSALGSVDGKRQFEAVVSDTGIGMRPSQIDRLFDKFEQSDKGISRRFGGTGLGLPISKQIIELMQGDITVKSALGEGSTFIIHFLLKEATRDMLPKVQPANPTHYDFGGYTALLVEDIELNREIVLELLADTALTIECAENGQQALDLFSAHPERYDLIFMDIHMPVMDGLSATRALRALGTPRAKTVPIIAMTANAFAEDVERCQVAGMNDHIAKPVDVELLLDTTARYLSQSRISA